MAQSNTSNGPHDRSGARLAAIRAAVAMAHYRFMRRWFPSRVKGIRVIRPRGA